MTDYPTPGYYLHVQSGDKYLVHAQPIDANNVIRRPEVQVLYQSVATGQFFFREVTEFNTPNRFQKLP